MKKYYRYIIAAVLVIATLLITVPRAYADSSPFSDVKPDFWAYSAIEEAYNDGVMTGTGTTDKGIPIFSSSGKLNMAQFVTALTRAFYNEDVLNSNRIGAWPNQNYDAAEDHNLFAGLKRYSSDVEVTREVMAQMMYNVMVDKGAILPNEAEIQATMNKIPDLSSVDSDFRTAVAVCYYLDLLSGVDANGTFAPKGVLNRAQTAVIYTRLKKAISVLGTGTPGTSNPGTTDPETTNPGVTNPGTTANPGTVNPGTITPDVPEVPSGATLTNGMPVTEENVLALIEEYRNGKEPGEKAKAAGFTSYTDMTHYDSYSPKYQFYLPDEGYVNGIECAKFAFAFMDDIFGLDAPIRKIADPASVRPGDLIRFSGHWAVITSSPIYYPEDDYYGASNVSGGSAGEIDWGNGKPNINRAVAFYTCYPN